MHGCASRAELIIPEKTLGIMYCKNDPRVLHSWQVCKETTPTTPRPSSHRSSGLVVHAGAIATHHQGPMDEFPELFKGLGKLNHPYTIQLRQDATLVSQSVVRRVAIPLMQLIKQELEQMEKLGVITRVEQPTDWCAGMVVVPKPKEGANLCRPH